MKTTISYINKVEDIEILKDMERFIIMDIENFENRILEADTDTLAKRILIMEAKMHEIPYNEYITKKRSYLKKVREAYINRVIELQSKN